MNITLDLAKHNEYRARLHSGPYDPPFEVDFLVHALVEDPSKIESGLAWVVEQSAETTRWAVAVCTKQGLLHLVVSKRVDGGETWQRGTPPVVAEPKDPAHVEQHALVPFDQVELALSQAWVWGSDGAPEGRVDIDFAVNGEPFGLPQQTRQHNRDHVDDFVATVRKHID